MTGGSRVIRPSILASTAASRVSHAGCPSTSPSAQPPTRSPASPTPPKGAPDLRHDRQPLMNDRASCLDRMRIPKLSGGRHFGQRPQADFGLLTFISSWNRVRAWSRLPGHLEKILRFSTHLPHRGNAAYLSTTLAAQIPSIARPCALRSRTTGSPRAGPRAGRKSD
jgi:hypothetical protein